MDTVKFVPPGGHRACLSCSAAKAKCVFPEDGPGGGDILQTASPTASAALGGIGSGTDATDGSNFDSHQHPFSSSLSGDNPTAGPSTPSTSSPAPTDGVPAVPKCERCERLGRDCLLPARPRKKRRVGPTKSGAAVSSRSSAPPSHTSSHSGHHGASQDPVQQPPPSGFLSTFTVNVDRSESASSAGRSPTPSGPGSFAVSRLGVESRSTPQQQQHTIPPSTRQISPNPADQTTLPTGPPPGDQPHISAGSSSLSPESKAQQKRQQQPPPAPILPPPPPPPRSPDPWHAIVNAILNMEEYTSQEVLNCYRTYFGPLNPAVELNDPEITAAYLKAERPLVWLAIVCVTSYDDIERQTRISKAIIVYVSEQVFQYGRKNLALLQGIITFLAGSCLINYIFPQYTNLISVALALTSDLGLDEVEYSRTIDQSPLGPHASRSYHGPARQYPEKGHTLESRRALVGVFVVSNSFSFGGGSLTPMQFSPQLHESCRILDASYRERAADPDAPGGPRSDLLLCMVARVYNVMARAIRIQNDADIAGRFDIPPHVHIENLINELNQLSDNLSKEIETHGEDTSNTLIRLVIHTAEQYIYKLGFTRPLLAPRPKNGQEYPPLDEQSPFNCMRATNTYFDIFLSMPAELVPRLNVVHYATLTNSSVMLARLTAYYRGQPNPPGAPPGVTLPSFNDILERIAVLFDGAALAPHPLGHPMRNPLFKSAAARFRSEKLLGISVGRKVQYGLSATEKPTVAHGETNAKPQATANRAHQRSAISNLLSIESLVVPEIEQKVETPVMAGGTLPPGGNGGRAAPDIAKIIDEFTHPKTEQAEWWAWFDDFHNKMTRRDSTSNSSTAAGGTGGSGSTSTGTGSSGSGGSLFSGGGSVFGGSSNSIFGGNVHGPSPSGSGFGQRQPRRAQAAPSVASIDSLLNNRDQEPNYDSYMQQNQHKRGSPSSRERDPGPH